MVKKCITALHTPNAEYITMSDTSYFIEKVMNMKKTIKVTGMTCKGCAGLLDESLRDVAGVKDVQVSHVKGNVDIDFDEKKTSIDKIKLVIKKCGYGA